MAKFFTPRTVDNAVEPDGPFDSLPCMIPGASTQRAVLFRSDVLVVAVHRLEVYPDSFTFTVRAEGRGFGFGRFSMPFTPWVGWPPEDLGANKYDQPEDVLRIGIEFSDGRASEFLIPNDSGPAVEQQGCSGSRGSCTGGFWVRELPPPGEFSIYTEWPSIGIDECSAAFDADELVERSKEAELLLEYHNSPKT